MGQRIKGSSMLQLVKALRAHAEPARAALAPGLHHYLEERIHVGRWYSDDDAYALMVAVARVLPPLGDDPWRLMGRHSVGGHLDGVYATTMRDLLDTPGGVHRYGDALWKSVHDTGSLRYQAEDTLSGAVEIRGYQPPAPEICRLHGAYLEEVMHRTGHAYKELSKVACVLEGADACRWRYRLERPADD